MRGINMGRYLAIVRWAARRWSLANMPKFRAVEERAANRYLGMR